MLCSNRELRLKGLPGRITESSQWEAENQNQINLNNTLKISRDYTSLKRMTMLHDCFFIKNRPKHLKRRQKEGKKKRRGRGRRRGKENEERRMRRRREGGSPSDHRTGLAITAIPLVCMKLAQISPKPEKKWFSASPTPTPPRFLQTSRYQWRELHYSTLREKEEKAY